MTEDGYKYHLQLGRTLFATVDAVSFSTHYSPGFNCDCTSLVLGKKRFWSVGDRAESLFGNGCFGESSHP
ncbi:hypothetical protein SCA6_001000 [Theobroma cacao]